jgi:hypothetical protein
MRIMKKSVLAKGVGLALLAGTMFQFSGCLQTVWQAFWTTLPIYAVTEGVTDNNAVFDLLPDGPGT